MMTLQEDLDKLVEANKSLYQAASKLHKKAADRIDTLEKGLVEIKEVAHISEGAEFYAQLADKTLGYDAEKRKKAETNLEDLMALTYGEHVWTDDDKG
jgi:hypothetical protein|tara:strand:+ start:392 stop:685 length:294 start_codon:yes stop_codon:yes gene_type:complete